MPHAYGSPEPGAYTALYVNQYIGLRGRNGGVISRSPQSI
jgi:hypothetical protein